MHRRAPQLINPDQAFARLWRPLSLNQHPGRRPAPTNPGVRCESRKRHHVDKSTSSRPSLKVTGAVSAAPPSWLHPPRRQACALSVVSRAPIASLEVFRRALAQAELRHATPAVNPSGLLPLHQFLDHWLIDRGYHIVSMGESADMQLPLAGHAMAQLCRKLAPGAINGLRVADEKLSAWMQCVPCTGPRWHCQCGRRFSFWEAPGLSAGRDAELRLERLLCRSQRRRFLGNFTV